jgi:hypothetical protein
MQKWSNVAMDDVLCLHMALPLVSVFGWLLVPYHFGPENRDITLLQNIGFYQPVHVVSKSKRTSS